MTKQTKLYFGIALVGVAAYLILKPKAPTTTASTEPKCKDDEISSTKIVNGKETKVCTTKYIQDHTAPRPRYEVQCVDGTIDVSNGFVPPCVANGGVAVLDGKNKYTLPDDLEIMNDWNYKLI